VLVSLLIQLPGGLLHASVRWGFEWTSATHIYGWAQTRPVKRIFG